MHILSCLSLWGNYARRNDKCYWWNYLLLCTVVGISGINLRVILVGLCLRSRLSGVKWGQN